MLEPHTCHLPNSTAYTNIAVSIISELGGTNG